MRNADQTRGWQRTCTYGAVSVFWLAEEKRSPTRLNEAASLDLHFALGALFRRSAVRALHGQTSTRSLLREIWKLARRRCVVSGEPKRTEASGWTTTRRSRWMDGQAVWAVEMFGAVSVPTTKSQEN